MLQLVGPRAGYFDWAIDLPIPRVDALIVNGGKLISGEPSRMELMLAHSQEGRVGMSPAMRSELGMWAFLPPDRKDQLRAYLYRLHWEWANPRRPSTAWHGTNLQGVPTGCLIQHAPIWARLAHGHSANPRGPGWEAEGFFSEPLDVGQRIVWYRMLADIEPFYGVFTRENGRLREHRQHGPTECPSERYQPLWEEMAMSMDPQHLEMLRLIADALGAAPPADSQNADGDRLIQLREYSRRGLNFPGSLDNLNDAVHAGFEVLGARLDQLEEGPAAGGFVLISGKVSLEPVPEEP